MNNGVIATKQWIILEDKRTCQSARLRLRRRNNSIVTDKLDFEALILSFISTTAVPKRLKINTSRAKRNGPAGTRWRNNIKSKLIQRKRENIADSVKY